MTKVFIVWVNDPAELWAGGPSARADCSRARSNSGMIEISGRCKPFAGVIC